LEFGRCAEEGTSAEEEEPKGGPSNASGLMEASAPDIFVLFATNQRAAN